MDIFWLMNNFWLIIALFVYVITWIGFVAFWKFMVPEPAKMLTKSKFTSCTYEAQADDMGYVTLLASKQQLPEGLIKTNGWRLFPRATFKIPFLHKKKRRRKPKNPIPEDNPTTTNPTKEAIQSEIESLALKRFILKGTGKPIWLSYIGKGALINPPTCAAIEEPKKMFWQALDPRTAIKETLAQMYTTSQLSALEKWGIELGMKLRGKEYGKLILGAAIIIGLVIIGIVAVVMLLPKFVGNQPAEMIMQSFILR